MHHAMADAVYALGLPENLPDRPGPVSVLFRSRQIDDTPGERSPGGEIENSIFHRGTAGIDDEYDHLNGYVGSGAEAGPWRVVDRLSARRTSQQRSLCLTPSVDENLAVAGCQPRKPSMGSIVFFRLMTISLYEGSWLSFATRRNTKNQISQISGQSPFEIV
jgi:hypothetical protein